ncbi:hypothetical protein Ppro_1709 [Pelobacter propionicus DSM 2379]|uniref:Lipoprotein n=1 Tax=Pelobacter propionicus (strain DSM 2379 / NBRC 103807 / OttBd1) TaxID=338966 RepID=A1APQ1_PELPD|nr:hypothetical protein Ppro_1709 [Pelobacter propionicus DSM 2379]
MEDPVKNSTLFFIALMLTACASPIPRAGSIVVNQFASDRYQTNNPSAVTGETVGDISRTSRRFMIERLRAETRMTVVRDCTTGDYELVGHVSKVMSDTKSRWWVFGFGVRQHFELELEAELRRCGTGEIVRTLRIANDGNDMEVVAADSSRDVIRGIRDMKR